MRYIKMPCILPVSVAVLALCSGVALSRAAAGQDTACVAGTVTPGQEETAICYRPAGDYSLGYRWSSDHDALKAAEYIYPHSSLTFGLDLVSCPLPYRYHVNTEFLSSYDFYTDAGFAYKDLVLFRDILVGAHHNLTHLTYQYPGEPPTIVYSDNNPDDQYYTDLTGNLLSLRLKAPDFPFHTFLSDRYVAQEGRVQQRFLLGDRTQINKNSESRDIDWRSNAVKLGANSHAGPVELEYAFDQARFNPGANDILYDTFPVASARPADIYPHDVVPETESSAHSIKLHSSYTGGIVTAATLSNLYQKNNYSLTESTSWKGAFDCSWIPAPTVGLFFKYRHKKMNTDTPDTVTLTGLNNTLNYTVREGVSSDNDVFSLATRYRPLPILALLATYEFSHLERQDETEWLVLPGQSNIHSVTLTADAKPLAQVKVKASYEYKSYDQPAYNNTPDNANKLRLTSTYTPAPGLNLYVEYIRAMTERSALRFLNSDPALLLEIGERDGQRDQLLASMATALSAKLSLTASWFYQRWDVEQDLVYGKRNPAGAGDLPYIDAAVPYSDESNSFSLALDYTPWQDLSLGTDVTYTISEGATGYDDVVGGAPFALSSFSALKAAETIFSIRIAKRFFQDWELGLKSYLAIYNDQAYDLLDGSEFTTICSVKRFF